MKRARARDSIDNVADHGRLHMALHEAALRIITAWVLATAIIFVGAVMTRGRNPY